MPSDSTAVRQTRRRIALSEPVLAGNEWAYLKECLDTGWVSSVGPFVERFEKAVAERLNVAHAVATSNGTAALHLALRVAGIEPEDEVLVPTLTFIAPVNAIRYCQAVPVFMDADPKTWQMDAEKTARFLEEACTMREEGCFNKRTGRRVRAILPVHLLGLACDMEQLGALAERFQLRVIEDAAEAMGVRIQGKAAGTFGEVGALSFNGNKIMTAGGGGMVITHDASRAEEARYLATQAKGPGMEYVHEAIGHNYRLTNLEAAVGLAQLEQLGGFIEKKRSIARVYEAALRSVEGLSLMQPIKDSEPTFWLYTVLLPEGTSLDQRRSLIQDLNGQGIAARPLWRPIHSLPPYADFETFEVEHADLVHARAVSLPCSVGLSSDDLDRCVTVIKESLSRL